MESPLRWIARIAAAFKKPAADGPRPLASPLEGQDANAVTGAAEPLAAAPSITAAAIDVSVPEAAVQEVEVEAVEVQAVEVQAVEAQEIEAQEVEVPEVEVPEITPVVSLRPDAQEIQRRRDLVRQFFNDFWSGYDEKPAAFVDRLDQAEEYLNERLAASGESWKLDAKARQTLGLPMSSVSRNKTNGAARPI